MLLTTTPGADEFSIVISAPRPPNALGWPVEVGTATTGTSVIAPIIVASEASRPATTTRQSTSASSVPSASRRADPAAPDVVDPDHLGAGHPGDEGGLRGDRGVAASGAQHADAAHRLGHRADGGGHRGGVHGRVRVVLAGQRDERLGRGAQHQRRTVRVLAPRLAHQGEDLLGAAAGAPDDVGLDDAGTGRRTDTGSVAARAAGTGPSSGSVALPVPRGGSGSTRSGAKPPASSVVQREGCTSATVTAASGSAGERRRPTAAGRTGRPAGCLRAPGLGHTRQSHDAVAAAALRVVQHAVGGGEQRPAVVAAGGRRDADADRHGER